MSVTTQAEDVALAQPGATSTWRQLLVRPSLGTFDLRPVISLFLGFAAWEIGVRLFVQGSLFIVPPSEILAAFVRLVQSGQLQRHFLTSAYEFLGGFLLASVAGILLGILMSASDTARAYLDPWISALYSTPLLAIAPLLILIFGLGVTSKIAIVFLVVVFVVLINTYTGLVNAPYNLVECARSFGASTFQIFTRVRLPAAVPMIIAGERLGIARALTGVVVAEFFGAQAGLGYLIVISTQRFETATLFVGVVLLALIGIILVELLKLLEAKLTPWRQAEERE